MFDWFHKTLQINTFYVLLVKILYLEKKQVSTSVCLILLFQEKMWLINWGVGGQVGGSNKKW